MLPKPCRLTAAGWLVFNFAIFSLWLAELFGTEARATAFAFRTSIDRFIGAGVNFGLAGAMAAMGTLGTPIAFTAIAFAAGLLIIPFATETRGETLPEWAEAGRAGSGQPETSFVRRIAPHAPALVASGRGCRPRAVKVERWRLDRSLMLRLPPFYRPRRPHR